MTIENIPSLPVAGHSLTTTQADFLVVIGMNSVLVASVEPALGRWLFSPWDCF